MARRRCHRQVGVGGWVVELQALFRRHALDAQTYQPQLLQKQCVRTIISQHIGWLKNAVTRLPHLQIMYVPSDTYISYRGHWCRCGYAPCQHPACTLSAHNTVCAAHNAYVPLLSKQCCGTAVRHTCITGGRHAGTKPRSSPHISMSLAAMSAGNVRIAWLRHKASCRLHDCAAQAETRGAERSTCSCAAQTGMTALLICPAHAMLCCAASYRPSLLVEVVVMKLRQGCLPACICKLLVAAAACQRKPVDPGKQSTYS